ncbi:MAG TPA: SDR family NAD(P)-dependent oxidoreductase [Gaiellaceae bacterium]|nr:SDR family NAD(P)-dependent oxidoreductase [Gaiellaceae bacterium]
MTLALVTGGGSGIGRAIAERLAADGADVLVVDVDEIAAQRTARAVDGRAVAADVGDPAEWARLADTIPALDVACLNAGVVTGEADLDDLSDEAYRRIMRVNVDGVVLGLRALIPLLERTGGDAVVTASLAGLTSMASDPVYSATKHFLVGLVRSAAPGLAARSVRLNAVCPGIVATPLIGDGRARLEAAGFPLLEPSDVAEAVALALASGEGGQAWVVQPGRVPEPFRFGGVPGPRVAGAEGVRPPL